MPTQTIVNGKSYTEYSPQEIDAIRLAKEIKARLKNGRHKPSVSIFDQHHTTNPSHKKQSHI